MSDKFHLMLDTEVNKMLKDSYERVKKLLKENESKLKDLAVELTIKETLSA